MNVSLGARSTKYLLSHQGFTGAIGHLVVIHAATPATFCEPLLMLHETFHIGINNNVRELTCSIGSTNIGIKRDQPMLPKPSGLSFTKAVCTAFKSS